MNAGFSNDFKTILKRKLLALRKDKCSLINSIQSFKTGTNAFCWKRLEQQRVIVRSWVSPYDVQKPLHNEAIIFRGKGVNWLLNI